MQVFRNNIKHTAEIMAKVAALYYYDGMTQARIAGSAGHLAHQG